MRAINFSPKGMVRSSGPEYIILIHGPETKHTFVCFVSDIMSMCFLVYGY